MATLVYLAKYFSILSFLSFYALLSMIFSIFSRRAKCYLCIFSSFLVYRIIISWFGCKELALQKVS